MSTSIKDRAEEVGERPDVKRWIKRFERLAKAMPPDVWVFVASGTPTIMARDEAGERFKHELGRGHHQDAVVSAVNGGEWDGGDW